ERAPVRLDAGVQEGDTITPHYDPMIAKLIVWGADRAQALARLDLALAQTHIAGLHTNVAFLRRVVKSRSFAQADLDTALIERERVSVYTPDGSAVLRQVDPIAHAADGAVEGGRLTAPMPGRVIAFLAKVGEAVKLGQPLAVMEAMKMEHTISAPRDGTVTEL